MIRTQVYITAEEKKMLAQLSKQTGETQSELIRKAIDLLCQSNKKKWDGRKERMRAAAGIWEDNDFDFTALRKEFDRKF